MIKPADPIMLDREKDLQEIPASKGAGIPLREVFRILREKGVTKYWGAGRTGGYSMGLCGRHIDTEIEYLEDSCKRRGEMDLPAYMTKKGKLVVVIEGRAETIAEPALCIGWKPRVD